MKRSLLLAVLLCSLFAAVAMAADAPKTVPNSVESGSRVYTIDELYKNSTELNKKKVVVKGEVVKVTPNIMGKIWTHLQDGTGDETKGTNDLLCISETDRAAVGDMVTVTGTVVVNPESRYKLVIEDATYKK